MSSHRLAQSSHLHSSASSAYSYPSKPHVLAGVQDAYWSDEEVDDNTCPLCIKELDLEERSFKPCPCGYQICLFCWHHIRQNLNGLCPACRREYTEEAVVWKAVAAEDNRRIAQQKKKKEKERKDLETLGRKQYLDVRIVQRNVVYVTGVGRKYAKEEMIPILRSNDYFGQYGKISKILLHKRTPPGSSDPIIGIYITYQRREDAARAIEKIDGSPSPSGDGEVMHASFGTAKYCTSFLRSVSCTNNGCLDVHEWGDERDCFTRQDLVSIKHLNKETEKRTTSATIVRKGEEAPTLPRTASWATRTTQSASAQSSTPAGATGASGQTIQLGPPGPVMRTGRQPRTRQGAKGNSTAESNGRGKDRKLQTIPAPSASRPSTPSDKLQSKSGSVPIPILSSAAAEATSNVSSPQAAPSAISSDDSALPSSAPTSTSIAPPPGLNLPPGLAIPPKGEETPLQPPPGLSRPPGLAPPSDDISSPIPTRAYQPSSQARALMEDTLARREAVAATPPPVFPDFDRTLANLALNTGFNFSFAALQLSESPASSRSVSRKGSTFDPFASPVEASYSPISGRTPKNTFDPFGDAGSAARGQDGSDGSRMASRFDFARRHGSLGSGREGSVFSLASRQPTRTEVPSTLYSSDASARTQQSWYQAAAQTGDYRSPVTNGVSSTSSLHSSVLQQQFEPTSFGDISTTPFQPFDMPESMQDLVRGFETPSLEAAASQLEQQQAQAAYAIQHQRTQQQYASDHPFQSVPPSPAGPQDVYAAPRMQMMNMPIPSSQPPRMARQDSNVARLQASSGDNAMTMNYASYAHPQAANGQQAAGAVTSNIHAAAPRGLTSSPADVASPNGEFYHILARGRVY